MTPTTAVLAMAYGSPKDRSGIEAFYTEVRRGRPPEPHQLAELVRRYDAIGGLSPLTARTAAQLGAIGDALERRHPGRYATYYGAKHAVPSIETAVEEIAAAGIGRLVGIVLAPHYSALSVGEYLARVERRASELGIAHRLIRSWGTEPELVELLAERVAEGLSALAPRAERIEVVFTAHSLPARVASLGDPYPDELAETARLVASAAGLGSYRTAYQSAARTPEPWLGPPLPEVLATIAADGFDGVLVVPSGFVSDHLEVLYDLDVEAAHQAADLGLAFSRTASLNAEARLGELLARLVVAEDEAMDDRPADAPTHR